MKKLLQTVSLALALAAVALLRFHWPARRWLFHALGWFWWGATPPTLHACAHCGASVTHDVHRQLWWVFYTARGHDAPCGAPCAGGVRRPTATLGDEYHASAARCARCQRQRAGAGA